MADEFDFFSNDCNNWNYNPFLNTPNADPYRERERERERALLEIFHKIVD